MERVMEEGREVDICRPRRLRALSRGVLVNQMAKEKALAAAVVTCEGRAALEAVDLKTFWDE
jgi:hypothetical protein